MDLSYLLPLAYVASVFFITQVLQKLVKVDLKKSPTQRDKDADQIELQIRELRLKQEQLDSVSQFVEHSLISRQIIALQKRKERLFASENPMRPTEPQSSQLLKKITRMLIENSLFVSLLAYFAFRHIEMPTDINPSSFYPLSNWLGFYQREGQNYFSITALFAFLSVRFCNTIGSLLTDQ